MSEHSTRCQNQMSIQIRDPYIVDLVRNEMIRRRQKTLSQTAANLLLEHLSRINPCSDHRDTSGLNGTIVGGALPESEPAEVIER